MEGFRFMTLGNSQYLVQIQHIPITAYDQILRFVEENPDSSEQLRRVLMPTLFSLIADQVGHYVFKVLLDGCDIGYLIQILQKFNAENEGFRQAAFCEPGSMSIQRLISRIKNSGLESAFTNFLAAELARPDFMTHPIASHVVTHCFATFGEEPNEVLHDLIREHLDHLAIDPVGCITIKASMDSPRNTTKRFRLPFMVAHKASQLSKDRWGNLVVQKALSLRNEYVSTRICGSLKGEFVELAMMQGGSRVVEKCLQTTDHFGRGVILDELFINRETFLMLACNRFGNYVVQTALKYTRMHDQDRYKKMVKVLKPRNSMLLKNVDRWFKNNKKY